MIRIRYYPDGDTGDVLDYLESLRGNSQKKKAAWKLDIDLQTLEEFWPNTLNVSIRVMRGWEPLRELKRRYEGINYRIFFCIRQDELWLLSNYEKESDDTPRNELEKAYKRMQDVLEGRV